MIYKTYIIMHPKEYLLRIKSFINKMIFQGLYILLNQDNF